VVWRGVKEKRRAHYYPNSSNRAPIYPVKRRMLRELSVSADANGEFIAELVGACSGYPSEIVGIRGQHQVRNDAEALERSERREGPFYERGVMT